MLSDHSSVQKTSWLKPKPCVKYDYCIIDWSLTSNNKERHHSVWINERRVHGRAGDVMARWLICEFQKSLRILSSADHLPALRWKRHTHTHTHTVWDKELDPQSAAVHPTLLSWPRLYNYTSLLSHSQRLSCFSSIVDIISFRLHLPLFALTPFPCVHQHCPRLHPIISTSSSVELSALRHGKKSPQVLYFLKNLHRKQKLY